jgi:hypothetical protein
LLEFPEWPIGSVWERVGHRSLRPLPSHFRRAPPKLAQMGVLANGTPGAALLQPHAPKQRRQAMLHFSTLSWNRPGGRPLPGMLHWNAELWLASSSPASGAPALRSCAPVHPQRASGRIRRFRERRIGRLRRWEIGFQVGSRDAAQKCRMKLASSPCIWVDSVYRGSGRRVLRLSTLKVHLWGRQVHPLAPAAGGPILRASCAVLSVGPQAPGRTLR